jgi:RNA recognition motif-containing protein
MTGARVYLGRLANSARERDIEKFFKGYGKIREIILKEGYGFIVRYHLFEHISLNFSFRCAFEQEQKNVCKLLMLV